MLAWGQVAAPRFPPHLPHGGAHKWLSLRPMFPVSGMVCSARQGLYHPHQALLSTPPTGASLGTCTACWLGTGLHPPGPPPGPPPGCGPGGSLASTLAGGDRVFSFPGAGWEVGGGGWSGTRPLGLGRWQRLMGGRGAGLHNGPRAGWRLLALALQPHLGTLSTAQPPGCFSRELAAGTGHCLSAPALFPATPPTHTAGTLAALGVHTGLPKRQEEERMWSSAPGGLRRPQGSSMTLSGRGSEGGRPLVRLQGPFPPSPPSLHPQLSARPLRSPVSRISGSRTVGAPP